MGVDLGRAPGEPWQYIAVGYCEWVNGDWPDDDDIECSRAPAKHIASYVKQWFDDAFEAKWEEGHRARIAFERNRYREALEQIEQRLAGYVDGGEPAAEDAADVLASVRRALRGEQS